MILHPGILALLTGSFIASVMLLYSSYLGTVIIKRWDIKSSSEGQLLLERRTYLISTIMNFILGFVILSALLFIYTADDIHRIFVGAMCATGSLNANPVGWHLLYTKISAFFLSSVWIALNYIDRRAEDYPLVKIRYSLLLIIAPLVILDSYLQMRYFLGLDPDIITSCCGALFSESGKGFAAGLSSLPTLPVKAVFFSISFIFILTGVLLQRFWRSALRYIFFVTAMIIFPVSVTAVVSFISLYYYEIPTHHCPFDILQSHYGFIGYPLYISLFGGTLFGVITGLTEPLRRIKTINAIIDKSQKKWVRLSVVLIIAFIIISVYPMVFSDFSLEGY